MVVKDLCKYDLTTGQLDSTFLYHLIASSSMVMVLSTSCLLVHLSCNTLSYSILFFV